MPYSRKTRTPRRKERRRRQLSRLGYDNDRILDILDYEFGLGLGLVLGLGLKNSDDNQDFNYKIKK